MDGVGRCLDNIRVERTWKTVKYEFVFLYEWSSKGQLEKGLMASSRPSTRKDLMRLWATRHLMKSMKEDVSPSRELIL